MTSFVVRLIRVGAPKRDSSWAEKVPTRWKTAPRTSLPSEAAVSAAMRVARIVARIWTKETPSIHMPARAMKPVSPTATPSSMIRPLRLGR